MLQMDHSQLINNANEPLDQLQILTEDNTALQVALAEQCQKSEFLENELEKERYRVEHLEMDLEQEKSTKDRIRASLVEKNNQIKEKLLKAETLKENDRGVKVDLDQIQR